MSKKKALEIDMIAGSQIRDTQGEMLDVEGADISELIAGNGRLNDNHGKGFFNSIGHITNAKKIFKKEDCSDPRHEYYWDKVKSPFIYVKGELYDDEDHPNARAAAAILRNVHREDIPLKMKCSVEGGVISRGIKDPRHLARTKIHSVALTFTPANQATLVEPTNLEKNIDTWQADQRLIKSVVHLAKTNVPSFRSITRNAQAEKIIENFSKINKLAKANGLDSIPEYTVNELIEKVISEKIKSNVNKINKLVKALTAGYGGAGAPTNMSGGSVIQSEALDDGKGFKYFTCSYCGKEQIHAKNQVKCREDSCNKNISLEQLFEILTT
jgi:hypothetical protein